MKKGSLVMFIPGAISLFLFLIVLVFLSVYIVEVEPKVEMDVTTSVDENRYQAHTAMNTLLVKEDSRFVTLVREYEKPKSDKDEIKNEIRSMVNNDLSGLEDPLLRVEFENGDEIEAGSGEKTVTETVIATPDGSAEVSLGFSGIDEGYNSGMVGGVAP